MTKDVKPTKAPKGDILIEFTKDVNARAKKGVRKVTTKEMASLLVDQKKAKILKEYSEGEVLKLAKAGKNYLDPK